MNTISRRKGFLLLVRWRRGIMKFNGTYGFDGLAHQIYRAIRLWWILVHCVS